MLRYVVEEEQQQIHHQRYYHWSAFSFSSSSLSSSFFFDDLEQAHLPKEKHTYIYVGVKKIRIFRFIHSNNETIQGSLSFSLLLSHESDKTYTEMKGKNSCIY